MRVKSVAMAALLLFTTISLVGCSGNKGGGKGQEAKSASARTVSVPFKSISSAESNQSKELRGGGGTFPGALYRAWFDAYKAQIQVDVKYDAVGSGRGIELIQKGLVDFGASDAPLSDEQLQAAKNGEILHVPTAFGGIVLSYNLPGLKEKLRLTSELIAAIYLGDITSWGDPRLVELNPELKGKKDRIITLHRADGSGTTFGFTTYLSETSASWRDRAGKPGTSQYWRVGIGLNGNDGVGRAIKNNPNSIGYVELNFALAQKLEFAKVKNKAGNFIEPTLESITAAAASAAPNGLDLRLNVTDAPGANAYPIATGTYILVYKNIPDAAKARTLARLLWWATHDGQAVNTSLFYASVPAAVTEKSEQLIRSITSNGRQVFSGPAQ